MDAKPYYTDELILAAQAGDIEARNELVTRSMGMIHHFTIKVVGVADVNEYLGSAVLGFMHAVQKFDVSRGFQLSTYASTAIMRAVHRQRLDEWRQWRRTPHSIYEVTSRLGTHSDFAHPTYVDPDPFEVDPDAAKLTECLLKLPERTRNVIVARMSGATLRSIGQPLGLTKERVRQIEMIGRKALERMMGGASFQVCDAEEKKKYSVQRRFRREGCVAARRCIDCAQPVVYLRFKNGNARFSKHCAHHLAEQRKRNVAHAAKKKSRIYLAWGGVVL